MSFKNPGNTGKYWRPFGWDPASETDDCHWCGERLRPYFRDKGKPREQRRVGDYGDGKFCGLRCAYQFAIRTVELGQVLTRRTAQ